MNLIKTFINKHKTLKLILSPLLSLRQFFIKKNYSKEKATIKGISKILVDDPIIWVDEFKGKFHIDINGDLFFRLITQKEYEPKLVKLCLKYLDEDKDIIDVGANIGFFTVLFAKNINNRRVLSIEPTKKALSRLHKNIELNKVKNIVTVFEGVASNKSDDIEIKTIAGKEEYSSIGKMNHPSVANEQWTTEKVKSTTLNELVYQNSLTPGFIKIDVEGAEHLVFDGAIQVLKDYRPIILSELNDFLLKKNGSSAKEVIDLIISCEYDVYDPINPELKPGQKDFGDIICFPKELKIKFI